MSLSSDQNEADLVEFLLLYAKLYLASGGPTSRLEDSLVRVGKSCDKETEVFATPTGVFVSIRSENKNPVTSLIRIKHTGTNLAALCKLEDLFNEIELGRVAISSALQSLKAKNFDPNHYTQLETGIAAFLAGSVISFGSYQKTSVALVSGTITTLVWFLSDWIRKYFPNPLFTDFLGAFLTLTLAALSHSFLRPMSIEAYALGGIVLLVPGLSLTTAIAELADQNLVSGTAKFMQATMALLALGLAYLLFQQLAFSLNLKSILAPVAPRTDIRWISALAILINISCFGIIFRTPPKALIWSTLTGISAWATLHIVMDSRGAAAAPFLAAVVAGVVSLALGKWRKLPSQVFSVPGIVALLPGLLALSSFRYFASGDQEIGLEMSIQVAITAVSIVFGLITSRLPFLLYSRVAERRPEGGNH